MKDLSNLLDKAALICVTGHQGQRDKAGAAYFQHPMRVAMKCDKDEEKIVALLHDILEDTDVSPKWLAEQGFPDEIVKAVLSVTRKPGETYTEFVERAKKNPIGRIVKIHDLEDNLNVLRLKEVSVEMAERYTKYLKALEFLKKDFENIGSSYDSIQNVHDESINSCDQIKADGYFSLNEKYTPEYITELGPKDIFVFGSNLAGAHGGGAARIAHQKFGAIWGQGVGLQGNSYAIPTMQGGVETIKPYVDEFIEFAKNNPDYTFYVTKIGCGIAGFSMHEIAPLFKTAIGISNIRLPRDFVEILSQY